MQTAFLLPSTTTNRLINQEKMLVEVQAKIDEIKIL